MFLEDLLKQLPDKQKKARSFDFQLDETTDISDKVQVIAYCRFADDETKTIVKFCFLNILVFAQLLMLSSQIESLH